MAPARAVSGAGRTDARSDRGHLRGTVFELSGAELARQSTGPLSARERSESRNAGGALSGTIDRNVGGPARSAQGGRSLRPIGSGISGRATGLDVGGGGGEVAADRAAG